FHKGAAAAIACRSICCRASCGRFDVGGWVELACYQRFLDLRHFGGGRPEFFRGAFLDYIFVAMMEVVR
ncbi:MAG: hypothetical protein ACD_75C01295G0001, partial [uncultured bacterium]